MHFHHYLILWFTVETTPIASKRRGLALRELFYITHVKNIKSILEKGILSHNQVKELGIQSEAIYNKDVVARREAKTIHSDKILMVGGLQASADIHAIAKQVMVNNTKNSTRMRFIFNPSSPNYAEKTCS